MVKKVSYSWTDSMSQGLDGEATWDPKETADGPWRVNEGKVVNEIRRGLSFRGEPVMTAYAAGPDGKEMQVLKITYTRK